MLAVKVSVESILSGGVIEMWKIEGLFYVKSIVKGVIKFSECVAKWEADQFAFEARYYGDLDF